VRTAAEVHDAVPRPTAVAKQRKRTVRDGQRENLFLRNEAKFSGGSPGRQRTRNVKTYGLREVPTRITRGRWRRPCHAR
jgi:hypothetical protein